MADPVSDPELLAKLNAPEPSKGKVTDPALLAVLEGNAHPLVAAHADMGAEQPKSYLQHADDVVRAIANGMTFGLADRFAAGMNTLTGRDERNLSDLVTGAPGGYAGNLAKEQARTEEFAHEHPVISAGANLTGGLVMPMGVVGAVGKGATLGVKTLIGAGMGGGIGAVQGALGSKDWTDLPQVAKDTAIGGGVGATIGAVMPGAAQAIGSGYQKVANAITGKVDGMSRAAGGHLVKAVELDGPAAVQARVAELGPDAMLSDAGPALFATTQGTIGNSMEGRAIATKALAARDKGTNARIRADVNAALGPVDEHNLMDPQTVTNAINAHRSAVDSVNYPAALDSAPDVQIAHILTELDATIPKSVGMEKKALENLRGMLTKPAEKATVEAASATGVAAKPVTNSIASDVDAIRAKYGDAAAAAYQRQNQPASAPSLLEFLASKGGLGPDAELEAIGAHGHVVSVNGVGRRKLVRQGGLPLDYAREAAEEAGYLQANHGGTSTTNDLLNAVDAEMRGQKRYPAGYEGTQTKREAVAMSEREQAEYDRHIQGLEEDLAAAGHGQIGQDVKSRAIHLMANEGIDANTAVQQAIKKLDVEKRAASAASAAPAGAIPQNDAEVLHKVKGELDNVIQYDAPGLGVPAGAVKNQQAALKRMRFNVNDALERQVPGYGAANDVSEALAKRAEAVQAGTQYLGSGKTTPSPERFAAEFEPLSQGEKIAFAKGSRGEVERILGVKANDLQALRGELQGEGGWNTDKLATVHGVPETNDLIASVDRNLKFRETHNEAIKGAQTDLRNAVRKEMKPDPSTDTPLFNPGSTMTGITATIAKKGVQAVANALTQSDPTRHYGEVARALTEQGSARDARLLAIVNALNSRQANAAAAPQVGNAGAVVAALLGKSAFDELRNGPSRRQPQ